MGYLNEISASALSDWLNNFDNEQDNIFEPFQNAGITLSKTIAELLSNDYQRQIRVYMGLDPDDNPRVIAVGAYELETADSEKTGYTDILKTGMIYELVNGIQISFSDANDAIKKWEQNSSNDLYKAAWIIPRPNMIKFLYEDNENYMEIKFGIEIATQKEVKLIMQKPNASTGDVRLDSALPCPPHCSPDTRISD